MKKKLPLLLCLFGIALVSLSLILTALTVKALNNPTDAIGIIGGASFPTYQLVFFHKYKGAYFALFVLGAVFLISSFIFKFKNRR